MSRVVEVRDLSVGYGAGPVVRSLNMHIDEGEVVALLGPNGAGKTTTLLAMSGLLTPAEGQVSILGKRPDTRRPFLTARTGLAHVPEGRGLFVDLTVAENLRLAAARTAGRKGVLAEAVGYFPALEALMARPAGLLSGGEQQMLALARGIATRPRAMLVDEMSLGLAPIIVDRILPVFQRIARETGVSVLLVEQHVAKALRVADRGYVLSHGELVLAGTAEELSHRRDLLVSGYLGDAAHL